MMGHPYKTPGYDQERNSQQGCLVDNDHRLLLTIAVINATNAEELLAVTTMCAVAAFYAPKYFVSAPDCRFIDDREAIKISLIARSN